MAEQRCCMRLNLNLRAARSELARLAGLEAYHSQRGFRSKKLPDMIRSAKADVERSKEAIEEHEAEHAGVVEPEPCRYVEPVVEGSQCLVPSHYELRA